MDRILRAGNGWQEAIADALHAATRPIPLDERLLLANRNGRAKRPPVDRSAFAPARPAATLLVLYPDETGQLVIPLTVRHDHLRAHAGEVSLPGGAVDPTDGSHEAAALREAWEEVGLEPSSVRVVGELDDVWISVSNYELRPIVGTLAARPVLVPHDAEVAAIVELPLASLFDPEVVAVEEFDVRGLRIRVGAYRHGGVRIWGATALTLAMFGHVLSEAASGD